MKFVQTEENIKAQEIWKRGKKLTAKQVVEELEKIKAEMELRLTRKEPKK